MVFGRKRKVVPFRSAGELDAMAAAGAIVGSAPGGGSRCREARCQHFGIERGR